MNKKLVSLLSVAFLSLVGIKVKLMDETKNNQPQTPPSQCFIMNKSTVVCPPVRK